MRAATTGASHSPFSSIQGKIGTDRTTAAITPGRRPRPSDCAIAGMLAASAARSSAARKPPEASIAAWEPVSRRAIARRNGYTGATCAVGPVSVEYGLASVPSIARCVAARVSSAAESFGVTTISAVRTNANRTRPKLSSVSWAVPVPLKSPDVRQPAIDFSIASACQRWGSTSRSVRSLWLLMLSLRVV